MPTAAQLTGASSPLRINGREFKARTLTDRDYVELDEYIQHKLLEKEKILIDKMNLSSADRMEMTQAALKNAAVASWATNEGAKIMGTIEGTARLGYQMVAARHSQLSFEEFYEHMNKSNDLLGLAIREINDVFMKLNTTPEEDSGNSEEDSQEKDKSAEE